MKKSNLFKILIIASIYFFSFRVFAYAESSAKANVCSITINSDDEIKTIQKMYMNSDKYNYYELTAPQFAKPISENEPSYRKTMFRLSYWFKNACDEIENQKIDKCDIVLVSGHYAELGSFYGAREVYYGSGLKLPLEQLEYFSFSNRCNAFFQKAKEVYLFGCQTLGQTGLTCNKSTDFMNKFAKNTEFRMRMVFPNAAIMGFKGLAPTGAGVAPHFKYFLNQLSEDRFMKNHYDYQGTLSKWNNVMTRLGFDKHGVQRSNYSLGINFSQDVNELNVFEQYQRDALSVYQGLELQQ